MAIMCLFSNRTLTKTVWYMWFFVKDGGLACNAPSTYPPFGHSYKLYSTNSALHHCDNCSEKYRAEATMLGAQDCSIISPGARVQRITIKALPGCKAWST